MSGHVDDARPRAAVDAARLPIVERAELIACLDEYLGAARASGGLLGTLLVGLAQLDQINHDYGYARGDALVRHIAATLRDAKRPTDVLVRVGIDEFVVILPAIRSTGLPLLAAQRVHARCAERVMLGDRRLKPHVRVGVALFPQDADSADGLLRAADNALMQCKRRNEAIVAYSESRVGFESSLLETQYDLANALDNGELYCEFQPKIALADDRLVGVEALSRWRAGNGKMIPPSKFIPVAEETGLITPITFRSLNESLRECAELQRVLPGLSVAVNLSAAVFSERHLREIVLEALQIWQVAPELLTLEVTESAVMLDIDRSIALLEALRDLGVRISIDDFGTGHSSLAYLRRLPASELKIDRSFVSGILADTHDRKLARAIIGLAEGLGLKTVAEGIEDAATLDLLREMGCTQAQGFHIARPLSPGDLLDWYAAAAWQPPRSASTAAATA
ncbi:MAG: bifunctional diguanylate cyclase/phosphodiesterase [Gammaproteobacteria bacterium]